MAGYWLKLYTEILDDPKYFRLSDNAKLGMIELMVVAKKANLDGRLPLMCDVSFFTRRSNEWWEIVYNELLEIKFLEFHGDCYVIRKFSERQKPVPATERSRQHRIVKQSCNEYATKRDGETEAETDTESEEKQKETAAIYSSYQNNITMLTSKSRDYINDAIDEYPHQWILDAINEAVKYNARNWAYVEKILKNWQTKGRGDNKPIDKMNDFDREMLRRGLRPASEVIEEMGLNDKD